MRGRHSSNPRKYRTTIRLTEQERDLLRSVATERKTLPSNLIREICLAHLGVKDTSES